MRLQKFLEHVLANGLTFKVKETKKTILIESYSEEKLKLDSWISMNKFYSYDDAESTLKGLIDEDEYELLTNDKPVIFIDKIGVKKSIQRIGIGSNLLDKCFEVALNKNINIILLNAFPLDDSITPEKLVNWYKKRGFKLIKSIGKNNLMIKRL